MSTFFPSETTPHLTLQSVADYLIQLYSDQSKSLEDKDKCVHHVRRRPHPPDPAHLVSSAVPLCQCSSSENRDRAERLQLPPVEGGGGVTHVAVHSI